MEDTMAKFLRPHHAVVIMIEGGDSIQCLSDKSRGVQFLCGPAVVHRSMFIILKIVKQILEGAIYEHETYKKQ